MSGSEYRLNVGAGKTLQLSFDSASEVAANELYIRFGAMPTRGQFDFAFSEPFAPDQEITFPTTNAGSYYILAYGANVSGAPNYSILAEIIPFSLRAIEPALAGNVGPVTLEIRGARFASDTAFQLVDPDGNGIDAHRVFSQDSTLIYATFNLFTRPTGVYDLRATAADGSTALLEDPLTVQVGTGPSILSEIDGPAAVRPNRLYLFNLNYRNGGDTDTMAPLFLLQSSTDTPMGLTVDTVGLSSTVQVLGVSLDGPPGILRPGDLNNVPVYFRSSTDPHQFP